MTDISVHLNEVLRILIYVYICIVIICFSYTDSLVELKIIGIYLFTPKRYILLK